MIDPTDYLADQHDPCVFCGETPVSGAWGRPCADSPNKLHDSLEQLQRGHVRVMVQVGGSLRRAAYELDKVAARLDALPPRLGRKVVRESIDLDPDLIRNEAERARDTLHVFGLLDV